MRVIIKPILVVLTILLGVCPWAQAELITQEIEYTADGIPLRGYIAYDDALEGRRPGILVVHEWWGHNDYARKRAEMLAELGYTALAVDMYGEGKVAEHPDDAGAFAAKIRENVKSIGRNRFLAALEVLKNHETVNSDNLAAIGYCFGGGVVLQMARMGIDLDGVVSFHGGLETDFPAQPGDIKTSILVCHGGADNFISPEEIQAFKEEMESAGADYTFKVYDGAKHSFTNPEADAMAQKFGLEIGYNAKADQQSWQDMQGFFHRIFDE